MPEIPMNPPDPLPTPSAPPAAAPEQGDSTGGIIPYKNPHALTAYYLGLFSLIPVLGLILGCVSVPLGISGLRQRKKRPIIRGAVHAWIGIIFGGVSVLIHLLIIGSIIVAAVAEHRR